MENNKNTVILDLEEYILLRDFKNEIEKGNVYHVTYYSHCGVTNSHEFISKDESINEVTKINEELINLIDELRDEIHNLRYPRKQELTIDDVKQMSVWKFLKWKRKR